MFLHSNHDIQHTTYDILNTYVICILYHITCLVSSIFSKNLRETAAIIRAACYVPWIINGNNP